MGAVCGQRRAQQHQARRYLVFLWRGPFAGLISRPCVDDSVPESSGNRKLEQIFFLD
jgi:hypothetical protein